MAKYIDESINFDFIVMPKCELTQRTMDQGISFDNGDTDVMIFKQFN